MAQPDSDMSATRVAARAARRSRFLIYGVLSVLLALALVAVDVLVLGFKNPAQAFSPHYYMALGNSLSFGYQPNLDFNSGFADDIYNNLLKTKLSPTEVIKLENLACAGETTETMIQGGCSGRYAHKGSYIGPQLAAAVDFLSEDKTRGRVSPVTLEIGANDVLPDWNAATCSAGPNVDLDLAIMDSNLTRVILPELEQALATPRGAPTGDLHLLNYYNPFAKACPNSTPFIHLVNDHLLADATQFKIPVVDVYHAFGDDAKMADNVCSLTWYCSSFHDIHPTNAGYAVIAGAVEAALGLPGTNPQPGIGIPAGMRAPREVAVWRRTWLA